MATETRCFRCGNAVSSEDQFCGSCGARVVSGVEPSLATDLCANCGASIAPGMQFCATCGRHVSGVAYAGFWLRFVAAVIDSIIVSLGFLVASLFFAVTIRIDSLVGTAAGILLFLLI